ncbi:hypothetical protein AcW1_000019 [Taiwanofungus camphoratus]|nr:hypothetical protein AcW2_001486 [Antrodia cinnamomea]KAI0962727.1 hypothetical protein AcW1_000019 [Antrodia cinnamomea]
MWSRSPCWCEGAGHAMLPDAQVYNVHLSAVARPPSPPKAYHLFPPARLTMDIWRHFERVSQHTADHIIYRSSAPGYNGRDEIQTLTADAVHFLVEREITGIVSFNAFPYADAAQRLLTDSGISYLHLPVRDFAAASANDLKRAYDFVAGRKTTLIHCGYGHGRTGTGVTAVQLHLTRGLNPPESEWMSVNHVEEEEQMSVLRQIRKTYTGK